MKKILFMAMAATMFAACTQNEEFENAGSNNKEMKFNTAVMNTTRAGVVANADFKMFKLYAYTGANNETAIIKGETFNGVGGVWTPETSGAKFYWPGEQNVNFYGYSVETMGDASYDATTVASPTLGYTVYSDIAKQEDLLIADKTPLTASSNNGTASIPFTHALTKMSFKITSDATSEFTYAITGIKVNANVKGTYEYANGSWNATTSTPVEFTLTAANAPFNGGDPAIIVNESLMMIPQADATITINYTIKVAGQDTPTPAEKTFTFTDWAKGKNIAYTIKLPSDAIKQITVVGEYNGGNWTETDGSL